MNSKKFSPEDLNLVAKIRTLTPEKRATIVQLIDFLSVKDSERNLTRAATKLSEKSLKRVWDNPEDAVYDKF